MTGTELLARVSAQPPVAESRSVRVFGPQLRAEIESGKTTVLAEVFAHPDQTRELRHFRFGHVVGPGLPAVELDAWQAQHPHLPLPPDLRTLLTQVNGIHLWADLDTRRAYFGILPLDEWQDVAHVEWLYPPPAPRAIVMSYHSNGDYLLIFDTETAHYLWRDLQDADDPAVVASSAEDMVDWFWNQASSLDPRERRLTRALRGSVK